MRVLVPLATGRLADHVGLQFAFIGRVLCYVYIALYGFLSLKR